MLYKLIRYKLYYKSFKDIGSKGYWGMISTIINNWYDVREIVREYEAPYCFVMGRNGVSQQAF